MLTLDWAKGEVPDTMHEVSTTGWVDTLLFKTRPTDHLLTNAVADQLILLTLDGHGSHYQPELIAYSKKNGVALFCLPPHTIHESQPLDISVLNR